MVNISQDLNPDRFILTHGFSGQDDGSLAGPLSPIASCYLGNRQEGPPVVRSSVAQVLRYRRRKKVKALDVIGRPPDGHSGKQVKFGVVVTETIHGLI